MLDSETRRKIDTLRDILVGKIPNPQTQVEQITTGLIYKFMDDMDKESLEMGGEGSFFVGDYEKYAWDNLLDPKLSGVEKVKLYSDAIEGMYLNPSAPQLFREMFRNAFLPFKDPSTLNMFLKEINEFHYSHSEKLGDAFEYLISIMGSQGDAGQFRTPRHIIDFIVDIIDPQKNETILDPACGTAGFLISSYKHILEKNTDKNLGDQLSAEDKKRVGENITGYDISPEMIRLSLVNMYLHGFSTPKIDEYDTLSSEDKWNEYFDVILANPPFFSPKGGIQPHKRFGVDSKKAEVLFTSYILEHLKPKGRAGIIVPEGIIFQTGTAYKELRKQLIEKALIGVISLPAGVFQPYSGVKTSILILDKELNQKSDSIFFGKVENDGFSLGSQRKPISQNDLPNILGSFRENQTTDLTCKILRSEVLADKNISLMGKQKHEAATLSSFDMAKLGDVTKLENGFAFKSSKYVNEGNRIIRITNVQKGLIIDDDPKFHPKLEPKEHQKFSLFDGDILISLTGNVGRVGRLTKNLEPAYLNQRVSKIEVTNPKHLNSDYLYWVLNSNIFEEACIENSTGVAQKNLSTKWIQEYSIPLPPIEVQQQIVDELEGYQKIIDGCRQVVENYKPIIDIDSSWEMVELGELCSLITKGTTPKTAGFEFQEDGINFIKVESISSNGEFVRDKLGFVSPECHSAFKRSQLEENDILFSIAGTLGRTALLSKEMLPANTNQALGIIRLKDKKTSRFVLYCLRSEAILQHTLQKKVGVAQFNLSLKNLNDIRIPLPPKDVQDEMVDSIERTENLISSNMQLIKIYTQKIQDRTSKVWGE